MNRRKMRTLLLCLLSFTVFVCVPRAFADYFKYTDSHGLISITNKLESVPPKYRATMKVVHEAPKPEPAAGKDPQSQPEPDQAAATKVATDAAPAAAPAGRFRELTERYVWLKPLLYVSAILALFVAVTKITSLLPSLLSRLIYVAFFVGVFVFVYQSYVEHIVESSHEIKEKTVNIMKKSALPQDLGDEPASGEKK
jgi:hypothetical protein